MEPLPHVFAVCCPDEGRWHLLAPSEHTLGRTFDRRELRPREN